MQHWQDPAFVHLPEPVRAIRVYSGWSKLTCSSTGKKYYRENATGRLSFYPPSVLPAAHHVPRAPAIGRVQVPGLVAVGPSLHPEPPRPRQQQADGLEISSTPQQEPAGMRHHDLQDFLTPPSPTVPFPVADQVIEDVADLELDTAPDMNSVAMRDFARVLEGLLTTYHQTTPLASRKVKETDWKKLDSAALQTIIKTVNPRTRTASRVSAVRELFSEQDAGVAVSYRWGMPLGEVYSMLSSVCDPNDMIWIDVLFVRHDEQTDPKVVFEVAPWQYQNAPRHVFMIAETTDLAVIMRRGWLLYEVGLRMLAGQRLTELVGVQLKAAAHIYTGRATLQGDFTRAMATSNPKDKSLIEDGIWAKFGKGRAPYLESDDPVQNFNSSLMHWLHLVGGMVVVQQRSEAGDHQGVVEESKSLSKALYDKGKFRDCLRVRELELTAVETFYGHDHLDVATTLLGVGDALLRLGDTAGALQRYEQALAIQFLKVGAEDVEVARSMHKIGEVHRRMGKLKEAQPKFEEAARIAAKRLGADHPEVARSLCSIGAVMQKSRKNEAALAKYQDAVQIKSKHLGAQHLEVAQVLGSIASVYQELGKLPQALAKFEEALKIRRAALGPDHLEVAKTEENLAGVMAMLGNVDGALPKFEHALRVKQKELGPDHIDVAATLQNIGTVLSQRNEFEEALPRLEAALAVKQKNLGHEHLDVARSLSNLGLLHSNLRDYEQAALKQMEALRIRQRALGPAHELTKKAQERLQAAQRKVNQLRAPS